VYRARFQAWGEGRTHTAMQCNMRVLPCDCCTTVVIDLPDISYVVYIECYDHEGEYSNILFEVSGFVYSVRCRVLCIWSLFI